MTIKGKKTSDASSKASQFVIPRRDKKQEPVVLCYVGVIVVSCTPDRFSCRIAIEAAAVMPEAGQFFAISTFPLRVKSPSYRPCVFQLLIVCLWRCCCSRCLFADAGETRYQITLSTTKEGEEDLGRRRKYHPIQRRFGVCI